MISYRHALSNACFIAALFLLGVAAFVGFKFSAVFVVAMLIFGAATMIVLAVKFDDKL